MAKLCPHHQRQIVNALEFLQTEVSALNASHSLKSPAGPLAWEETVVMDSGLMAKPGNMMGLSTAEAVLVPDISAPQDCSSPVPQQVDSHVCEPLEHLPPIDFMDQGGIQLNEQAKGDPDSNDVKNSLVGLSNSSHTLVGTLEDYQCNSKVSSDLSIEPLPTAYDPFDCSLGSSSQADAKDLFMRPNPMNRASKTISPATPRTARKSCRGPHTQTRDSSIRQVINDPDINYDIVYISKPITEIELEPKKRISPRRTARKSTRGYTFFEDFLELRTVRTLARKSSEIQRNGNCPAPVAEVETVTPKQALSKPDGIPPVDAPFVGGCGETAGEGAPIEKAVETKCTRDDVTEEMEVEPTVETSQTDQPRPRGLMSTCLQGDKSQPSVELDPMGQVSPRGDMFSCLHQDESQLKVTTNQNGPLHTEGEKYVCSQESELVPEENLIQDFVPDSKSKDEGSEKNRKETVSLLSDQPLSMTKQAQDNSVPSNITDPSESIPAVAPEEDPFIIEPVTALDGKSQITLGEDYADVKEIGLCSEPQVTILHQSENEESDMVTTCLENNAEPVVAEEHPDTATEVASVKDDTVEKSPSVIDSTLRDEVSEIKFQEMIVCNTLEKSQSSKENGSKNSDRCLRSRVQLRDCESVTISRTAKKTSSPIKGFQENDPKNTFSERSQKNSIKRTVLSDCLPSASDKTLLESAEILINKSQASDAKPNDCKVGDNRVQTRQNSKSMSHEEPGENGGNESVSSVDGTNLQERDANLSEEIVVVTDSVKSEIPDHVYHNVASAGVPLEDVPMRRESKRIAKSVNSGVLNQSSQVVLRSQSAKAPGRPGEISTEKTNESRHVGCSVKGTVGKSLQPQRSVSNASGIQSLDTTAENSPKFLEALRGEETQQLIAKLNTRYDKMQKGWIQLDKDGQAISRPRNKADRLKDVWKSKRRSRKPKFCDGQKYSPVQMLFMKTFDLATVCRWFLQSTETRSLVIVKKVNTRLPSEAQLGFYGASGLAGNSRALFPSLQAERLKKHLKKFPVASPVKSNLKNQQLIAKTREHNGFPGKELVKTELTTATRISTKPNPQPPPSRSQAAASANLPARSRILRKYSNIREKLQGQRQKLQPGRNTSVKTVLSSQSVPKIKSPPQALKKPSQDSKLKKRDEKVKTPMTPSRKKQLASEVGHGKQAKSRSDRLLIDGKMPARAAPSSQSVVKPPSSVPSKSKGKAEDQIAASKKVNVCGVQKVSPVKMSSRDPKEPKKQVESGVKESGCSRQTKVHVAPSPSKAQVLTRSQRKMETMPAQTAPTKPDRKRTSNVEPPLIPAKMTRKSSSKTESCPAAENGHLL